ncbi:hypothetical protein ACTVZO_00410 [Streptomyces sp. IBSNAI002]|uniref:hypothetical protein n=1 Tax=Streptomyces sp. IBSNAI002 TaxID=3457500 RepID=UPI003FD4B69E
MRYARPVLTSATTLFALSVLTLGSIAHANSSSEKSEADCAITNSGHNNNMSCGYMIVGNNNTTGTAHKIGLGSTPGCTTFIPVRNSSTHILIPWVDGTRNSQMAPGSTNSYCSDSDVEFQLGDRTSELSLSFENVFGPLLTCTSMFTNPRIECTADSDLSQVVIQNTPTSS